MGKKLRGWNIMGQKPVHDERNVSGVEKTTVPMADSASRARHSPSVTIICLIGALILFGGLVLGGIIDGARESLQKNAEIASDDSHQSSVLGEVALGEGPPDLTPGPVAQPPQSEPEQHELDFPIEQIAPLPFLGIVVGSDTDEGVRIHKVLPGSAAAQADLLANDLILLANAKQVDTPEAFRKQISQAGVGGWLEMELHRDNESMVVETLVGAQLPPSHNGFDAEVAYLGVNIGVVAADALDIPLPGINGVTVLGVEPDSPAWRSGVRERDVIVSIDDEETSDAQKFVEMILSRQPGDVIHLMIYREVLDNVIELDVALGVRKFFGNIPDTDLHASNERGIAVDGLPPQINTFVFPQDCPPEDDMMNCM
jgi:membrane-associated protease RseP (regulator of RpoE activity)